MAFFLLSAKAATAPASLVALMRYEGAKVSGLVASQTRCFPLLQGTTVTPSGRFPSACSRPGGSRREGTFAVASDRCMMLFSAPWRWWRPWLRRQLRPCVARASTSKPQCWQVWGLHKGVPRRNPTATLTVWSSMRRPREEIGRASNHAPDSLAEHASRRARALGLDAVSRRLSATDVTVILSQDF